MIVFDQIESVLADYFEVPVLSCDAQEVSGGDIHSSYALTLTGDKSLPKRVFAKANSGDAADVLYSEYQSLKEIDTLCSGLYPKPLLFHQENNHAVLIMSFYQLGSFDSASAVQAGKALAEQHKLSNLKFGWGSNNYIGLTPQPNHWRDNWVDFFREQRLLPMLDRACQKGLSQNSVQAAHDVVANLDEFLGHQVIPALVHGDLWSGNLSMDTENRQPLFFDPAPYYGDREVDIAMTELFGRQADAFYQAYEAVSPLDKGYEQRRPIYNLYHALNHVVLFGTSYNGLVRNLLRQITN